MSSIDVAKMSPTFDDEFDNFDTVSGSDQNFTSSIGTIASNDEAEFYSNSSVGVNPFTDLNGVLTIAAAPATPGVQTPAGSGLTWTSGEITTRGSFQQTYGYFEISAELPAGQGMWPAFWMLPADGSWPPELDVMEMLGQSPTTLYTTVHSDAAGTLAAITQAPNMTASFHTYGVDWEPNTITWYLDGQEVYQIATPSDMNQAMYLIADLAVGGVGSWPGPTNSASASQSLMQIDYIRAFSTDVAPVTLTNHANDLSLSSTASSYNNFIDMLNFEASFNDLISAFGANSAAMQTWYSSRESVEKRVESFDGLDYVASYTDLIHALGAAGSMAAVQDAGASHFIAFGNNEGRTTIFNGLDYIASYGDLIKAFGANNDAGAYHFIEYGSDEGRTASFDGLDYIASYSDLINAFGANEQAGAAHYIDYGFREGRETTFNGLDYIASYGNLITTLGANSDAGATQYIEYGFGGGLTTTFDGLEYIANYTDLMKAFGANEQAGAAHYIDFGYSESRNASFNVAAYESAHPDLIGKYATNDQFLTAYINTYVSTGQFLT